MEPDLTMRINGDANGDLEIGDVSPTSDGLELTPTLATTNGSFDKAFLPPQEPYLTLKEIAQLHPMSRLNIERVEASAGLSVDIAQERLLQYGRNILTPPPKTPEWMRFLKQFQNTFLLLLLGSAILSVVAFILDNDLTNLYLGIVLVVVVFLTALVQFHEEGKAFKIVDSFSKMLAKNCEVVRDGKQQTIDVEELVPGDVVIIKNGDKVPADLVLLLCRGLKAESSSLTGESEPIACSDKPSQKDTRPFECKNMVFNSSLCFDGGGVGLVVRTGDLTAIGNIAKLASDTELRPSTLQLEVSNFVRLIAYVAVTMATLCFAASVFIQQVNTVQAVVKIFVNGFLVIIVANVPQGLPSTVISLLSLAARNMAKRSVLVKRLDCVETLGSTSIICSDKTGTLTKNEMTVTDVWCNQRLVKIRRREAKSLFSQEPQSLLYRISILCNRGQSLSTDEQNQQRSMRQDSMRKLISNVSRLSWRNSVQNSVLNHEESLHIPTFAGNPSDVALLTYCDQLVSVSNIRQDYPVLFEVPFNSTNKWQLVVVKSRDIVDASHDDLVQYEVLMKGAPEVLLNRCTTYATTMQVSDQNHQADITDEFRSEFNEKYESFAAQGRRVLALASKTFLAPKEFVFAATDDHAFNFPTTEFNFVGLVAIMDPPRDNVPDAIAKCHRAGLKVFMVTGDHPYTAQAIAKEVGLLKTDKNILLLENETSDTDWNTCNGAVIHGSRIDALTDAQWTAILSKAGVCFARTTPAHKLLIVQKCQTLLGAIVAVTGDGVNDAPALKQADVGVAMGLNGSAVAQDAADLLLMDDNFASIVDAIEEGRIIFDNIKKTIAYTMAHIFPEVVSVVIALLGGIPPGLTAMQVLTIDLGTEIGPAISLAYERAENDIMDRAPRDPKRERLVSPSLLFYSYVTSGFIITIGCMLAYIFQYRKNGIYLSDFYHPELDKSGGNYFSLTSTDPVMVERTGQMYSAEEQRTIFSQSVTAFYVTLTVAQFCHIWACKTRISSLFTHGFSNKLTFYGVAAGLAIVIFFSYIPGVQEFVGSALVGWIPWVTALATGSLLLLYNETSKWYARRSKPDSLFVRFFSW